MIHRRALAGLALCAAVSSGVLAQERPITVTRLTEKLYLLSVDEANYNTNALAFVGADGVLLVDTQSPEDAATLRATVASLGGGPVRYIINTHRHVEHIGGNAAFGPDPIIIAHTLVPSKMRSGNYVFDEFPPEAFPDITVADSMTLVFNGERIRIVAIGGSHDDNELMVHFVDSRVVHLSSVVNGFNFPSVDADGDALRFPELVGRAIALLPHDVAIVSGHFALGEHRAGTWAELGAYRDMTVRCIEIVRAGLARGQDVATLQRDSALRAFTSYARSYVSADDWIATLVTRLTTPRDVRPLIYLPVYETWKAQGAAAAVARFTDLHRNRAQDFRIPETALLVMGIKTLSHNHPRDALTFLEGSLREYPEMALTYRTHYEMARAHNRLGDVQAARRECRRALELRPGYRPAVALLEALGAR